MGFLDRFRRVQNERPAPPVSIERTQAVQRCVQSFLDRDWEASIRQASALARERASLQVVQMLLISMQRIKHEPEDEDYKLLWDDLVKLGRQMQGMDLILVRITLGEETLEEALRTASNIDERCKAYYYAGARLLSTGYLRDASIALTQAASHKSSTWELRFAMADLAWAGFLEKGMGGDIVNRVF